MCRSKELGGRRCPQYTDPIKHAAYNKHRREVYAANKKVKLPQNSAEGIDINETVRSVAHVESDPVHASFLKESYALRDKIHPDYAIETGLDKSDKQKDIEKRANMISSAEYYTREGYKWVSVYLNHENPTEQAVRYYADYIKGLDSIVSAAGLREKPIHVYRGIKLPQNVDAGYLDQWLEEKFPVGGVISQPNYMSTSVNPVVGINFGHDNEEKIPGVFLEILTRKGAALGEQVSAHANNEHEVLLPRDARFRVESIVRRAEIQAAYADGELFPKKVRTFVRLVDADEEIN